MTQATQQEILMFIKKKLATNELWVEAFAELATLDEISQDAIVYWMLEDIKQDKQWDETLERTADKLAVLAEKAVQEVRERDAKKAERRRQKAAPRL